MAGPYSAFFNPQVIHMIHGSTKLTLIHTKTCNPNRVVHSRFSKILRKNNYLQEVLWLQAGTSAGSPILMANRAPPSLGRASMLRFSKLMKS
jgi:hypothetical protein